MKKLFLIAFAILCLQQVNAQDAINEEGGSVGIGTTRSSNWKAKLTVNNASNYSKIMQLGAEGPTQWFFGIGNTGGDYLHFGDNDQKRLIIAKNSGKIGIGTTKISNWKAKFTINNANDYSKILQLGAEGPTQWFMGIGNASGNYLHFGENDQKRLTITKTNGFVGIGRTNPQNKLQVSGKGASTGDTSLVPSKWQAGIGHVNGADQGEVLIGTYGKQPALQGHGTGTGYRLLLNPFNGNVGIGTYNPDAKLTVAGKIHSREVKVTVDAGADFVFANDYKLPKLEDVESFVTKNKHLPEIAPAKEMEANGIHLGEMNIKLLQKIEELTLYTIQQQKDIKALQNENKELKSLNQQLIELQSRVLQLENKN